MAKILYQTIIRDTRVTTKVIEVKQDTMINMVKQVLTIDEPSVDAEQVVNCCTNKVISETTCCLFGEEMDLLFTVIA